MNMAPQSCPSFSTQRCPLPSAFWLLPAELRLQIWTCAAEPRVLVLDDLVHNLRSHPLPSVAQLNVESRSESRDGYEPVGRGSYVDFARDIIVCDPTISDQVPPKALQALEPRVRRLVFWDCFPDDGRICGPHHYSAYVTSCYQQSHFGKVEFNKLLFPNLKDLWIVKVGEVDRSWKIEVDRDQPQDVRLRKTARQFRYWIKDSIIEIAPLNLDDPETKLILSDGRCRQEDCRQLNSGRNKMISKIMFMDGEYRESKSGEGWARILPWSSVPERGKENAAMENRLRWIMVERNLTFSLRWDADDEMKEGLIRRQVP